MFLEIYLRSEVFKAVSNYVVICWIMIKCNLMGAGV